MADMIQQFFSSEIIHALGWTLVHTLWQAACFALVLGLLLLAIRKYSARARYNVAIGVLLAFCLTTVLTFTSLYRGTDKVAMLENGNPGITASTIDDNMPAPVQLELDAMVSETDPTKSTFTTFFSKFSNYYNDHLPLIVTLWLMGVLILQLRFLGQLVYLQRLKNYGVEQLPAKWTKMLRELETKIGLSRPVRYLSSFRVDSPFTAGWLKPVILFPATLLEQLNEAELRSIMAHELAHVKRQDFLVNLAQTLLCILFFYHPAVWWMSARIEDEREHCCDDLAIQLTGERIGYAKTLIQLKEAESAPKMAMGFFGRNGFKQRISRLLSGYLGTGTYGEGFSSAIIIACIMGVAVSLSAQHRDDQTDLGIDRESPVTTKTETQSDRQQPLIAAARAGETATVGKLLRGGANPNDSDGARRTALSHAAEKAHAEIVDLLLEYGAITMIKSSSDLTALDYAVETLGNMPLYWRHTDKGSRPQSDNDHSLAFNHPMDQVIKSLLRAGATSAKVKLDEQEILVVNQADHSETIIDEAYSIDPSPVQQSDRLIDDKGTEQLVKAVTKGQNSRIDQLIKSGINLDGVAKNGRTALTEASFHNYNIHTHQLVKGGADINGIDGEGYTPLTMAAKHNHTSTFDHLLQLGADPNLRDGRGLTAKEIALRDGSAQMLRLLNFVGGNVTAVTRAGGNPLTGPASDGYLEVLEYLLKEGTNPNDHVGHSPLFVATRERQHKAIKLLARYRAAVDAPGDYSDVDHYYRPVSEGGEVLNFYQQANPLMLAITQVDLASVTTLIAVGADVNTTCRKLHYRSDKPLAREKGGDISQAELEANYELVFNLSGWTPLMEAVETNNTKMVKTLLEAGADADRVLTGGYSARSLAKEIGNAGIIELLNF